MPQWQDLNSSNLRRCSYDIETGQLQIQFVAGKTYSYSGVPASVYNGLLEAPSAGQYFNKEIKGVYE
jgi:lysyl-tRNA synthetase class 2